MTKVYSNLDLLNASKIVNLAAPTTSTDASTKGYVDTAVNSALTGLAWKQPVVVLATTNINLASPGASIDGVTLTTGDRILLTGQTSNAQNGIYIFDTSSTALLRADDANSAAELNQAVVSISSGTYADQSFRQTEIVSVLGTDPIIFVNFGAAAANATETISGVAELATQAEVNTGTDDARIVTPLKLATRLAANRYATTITGNDSATQFTVTHGLGTRDVISQVRRNSAPYDYILVDMEEVTDNNSLRLTFSTAPAASDSYRVIVLK
jgi:hypothetical protein